MNFKAFITTALLAAAAIVSEAQDAVKWTFSLAAADDGAVEMRASADIAAGWHIYDVEVPEGGPFATGIEIDEIKGAEAIGKFTSSRSTLHNKFDQAFEMEVGYHEGRPVFIQRLRITDRKAFVFKGDVRAQACNDQSCTAPTPVSFSFTAADLPALKPAAGAEQAQKTRADAVTPTPAEPAEAQPAETAVADTSAAIAPVTQPSGDLWMPVTDRLDDFGAGAGSADMTLLWIFLFGVGGGLLALLTPCVWPMIPMTVSFFLKRSGRGKAVRDALLYGLSIVVIYVALGLVVTAIFGASALNDLATSALFNLIFFALLLFFAVSFFGAFDLTLPSSWTNKADSKADSTTGLLSIFFMAFTLALVSFSCTGPVIGWLLVEAASSGAVVAPAVGMTGFAIALAVPFALFALFPSWLGNLPKSGGWLNSVKVVLGFLELALALKFLSVADLAYGWGILDREVFLSLWIVIFALLGVYLLGKLRLPHDGDLKHVSVGRMMLALTSLSFAVYMAPGLWGAPLKAISAFSPPLYTQDFNLYDGAVHAAFDDYDAGMEYAARHNKPVAVDFSGFGCVNCRKMEAAVWSDPRVKAALEKDYVLITLMVDDKTRLPEPIEVEENGRTTRLKTVGDRWSYLQRHKFGTNSQPCYVLLDGGDGQPLNGLYAFDENVDKFLGFLKKGLENYRAAR